MNIKKIGVLGAGQMGMGIAQVAAAGGFEVIIRDIKEEFCNRGMGIMLSGLKKRVEKGKMTEEAVKELESRISTTERLEDLADCDMIIEAAPENLELKRKLFADVSAVCKSDAILCTNTSSISVTQIMESCQKPERCCGMHFFFPVPAMRLVELIQTKNTAPETIETVREVAAKMGKTAVLCKTDTPGFIVNRCLFSMLLEAVHCYEDGVASAEDIDLAMKLGLNHPMGPFEMMDMSGLDTFPHVCESLSGLPVTDWSTPAAIEDLVKQNRLGRKNGHGWYDYT